jgi:hypothetical protein
MIEILAGLLFDFRTIGVLFVGTIGTGVFFSVRLNLRDRRQAGVNRTTKHARASQRPEAAGIPSRGSTALGNLIGTDPIGSRDFDGKVIFYSPAGPVDLSRFFRDVGPTPDAGVTLETVNDSTARGDHVREAPDRPEHEGDTNRAPAIHERLDGDEPLRAARTSGSGGDEPARTERSADRPDPFDGADPIVFGRAGAGGYGHARETDQP